MCMPCSYFVELPSFNKGKGVEERRIVVVGVEGGRGRGRISSTCKTMMRNNTNLMYETDEL